MKIYLANDPLGSKFILIRQPFYQPCLFSHQCLILALTVLYHAYFRDMLIFKPMLIFVRVSTVLPWLVD